MYILAILIFCAPIFAGQFESVIGPIFEQAKKLAQEHAQNPQFNRPIISIAGCVAVGKSYFARELKKLLKKEKVKATILRADDFYEPTPIKNALIHPYFNQDRLHEVLKQVIEGKEHIEKPVWDTSGKVRAKEEETACFWGIDIILFEGIYTLCDESNYDFLKYSSLKIFLDATQENINAWNWQRELSHHPDKVRTKEKFDNDVKWDIEDYHKTIAPMKKHADFILTKDANYAYTLINQMKMQK